MADGIDIPSPSVFLRSSPSSPAAVPPSGNPPTVPQSKPSRRPGKVAKKNKSTAAASLAAGSALARPKLSKSRNGCITCKEKRLKCGEERPKCQQCIRRGIDCGGYKKDFKWRPFEESSVKFNIDRKRQASSTSVQQDTAWPSSTRRSSIPPSFPFSAEDPRPAGKPGNATARSHNDPELESSPHHTQSPDSSSSTTPKASNNACDSLFTSPKTDPPEPAPPPLSDQQHEHPHTSPTLPLSSGDRTPFGSSGSNFAPRLSPNLVTSQSLSMEDIREAQPQDFVNFSMPEDMQFPSIPSALMNDMQTPDDLIFDEEIERNVNPNDSIPNLYLAMAAGYNRAAMHSPAHLGADIASLWPTNAFPLYSQPGWHAGSEEALVSSFMTSTCGILSVTDGEQENPWRTLVWPMAQHSPALMHAVLAMTAFHSSGQNAALRMTGHEHKAASISYIREGISQNSMTDQTAIATALALGFAESWDQHTASGNTHIKGAQGLVKRALANHAIRPLRGIELARLKFLCNAWVYMDVIARLTAFDTEDSCDFDNTFLFAADAPRMVLGVEQNGFGIDFGMPIDARLDPLMGCAGTLFPVIGRVATVVKRVCRSKNTSPSVISQAGELKDRLEKWEPPAFIERPEDPSTAVQHALQTAEAYRWATLLHLHQSVPELPSISSAELAQRVLQYLATVPLSSRTVIIQIFPLMVAGCEASTPEDRDWVRQRWDAMSKRMRIGVIEKSARVTEEVWKRRDWFEAQPPTNRRIIATADLQEGSRRHFPDNGSRGPHGNATSNCANEGMTGMVYSWDFQDVNLGMQTSAPLTRTSSQQCESQEMPDPPPARPERRVPDRIIGPMEVAYTVRGHLHWVGVMWDWGWEVLLG